jgi:hypothetical protein
MALFDDIDSRRELVKRLLLAELLARPGRGPLALRGAGAFPRARAARRAPAADSAEPPREPPGEGEP